MIGARNGEERLSCWHRRPAALHRPCVGGGTTFKLSWLGGRRPPPTLRRWRQDFQAELGSGTDVLHRSSVGAAIAKRAATGEPSWVRALVAANRASTDTGSVEGRRAGWAPRSPQSGLHRHRVGGGRRARCAREAPNRASTDTGSVEANTQSSDFRPKAKGRGWDYAQPQPFVTNHSASPMTGVKCARELSPFPAPSCVNSPDSRKTCLNCSSAGAVVSRYRLA